MNDRKKLEILKQAAQISDSDCGIWAYEKWDEFKFNTSTFYLI